MPTDTPSAIHAATAQAQSPSPHPEAQDGPLSPAGMHGEGQTIPTLRNRVQRVQHDLEAGRVVSDDELRRYGEDCRFLLESTHGRWMASGGTDEGLRAEANSWMRQMYEAARRLSPEWKAAREAQILNAAAGGTGCYFVDRGEADRVAMNEGRGE